MTLAESSQRIKAELAGHLRIEQLSVLNFQRSAMNRPGKVRNARKGTQACHRLQNQYHGVVLRVSRDLDIETDVQDVAVLDPVILAFQAKEPLFADGFL
jgi:hypothetical protein